MEEMDEMLGKIKERFINSGNEITSTKRLLAEKEGEISILRKDLNKVKIENNNLKKRWNDMRLLIGDKVKGVSK